MWCLQEVFPMNHMNFMPFFSRDNLEWNTKLNMLLHLTWLLTARPYFEHLIYKLCISDVILLSWKMWCHIFKFTKLQPHHNYCNLIAIGLFAARFKVVHLALHITIKLAVWIPCSKNFNGSPLPAQWQKFLSQAFKSLCNLSLLNILWVQAKSSIFLSTRHHFHFNIT